MSHALSVGVVSGARCSRLPGFCTGVDREVFAKEPRHHADHLFDPSNKVIGQENELYGARKVPAYVARKSFVFHHKEGTLSSSEGLKREDINMCHANFVKGKRRLLRMVDMAAVPGASDSEFGLPALRATSVGADATEMWEFWR